MKKIVSLLLFIIVIACCLFIGCKSNSLNEDIKNEIMEDFLLASALSSKLSKDDIDYTYLGQYGESYAVYFHTSGAYNNPVEEKVGIFKFSHPDSRTIKIWNNSKFYKLSEAYDLGLIKWNNVVSIWFKTLLLDYKEPYFYFEDKVESDIPPIFYEKPDRFYWNILIVDLDKHISGVNSIPDISFFDCNNIAEIRDITPSSNKKKGDGNFNQIIMLTLNIETPNEAANIRRHIKSIDGVKEVTFDENWLDGLANDNYYTSDLLWGLDEIEIEKVWDFTTGS